MRAKSKQSDQRTAMQRWKPCIWVTAAGVAAVTMAGTAGLRWPLRTAAAAAAQKSAASEQPLLSEAQVGALVNVRLQRMQRRRAARMAREPESYHSFEAFERRALATQMPVPRTPPRPKMERGR